MQSHIYSSFFIFDAMLLAWQALQGLTPKCDCRAGKLNAALDVDETLIQAWVSGQLSGASYEYLHSVYQQDARLPHQQRTLFKLEGLANTFIWLKLRPFVRDFLDSIRAKYVLWLVTNGERYIPTVLT